MKRWIIEFVAALLGVAFGCLLGYFIRRPSAPPKPPIVATSTYTDHIGIDCYATNLEALEVIIEKAGMGTYINVR
jgi:hypothetical protein